MTLHSKISIASVRFLLLLFCAGLILSGCMHAPALDDGVMLGKHLVEKEKDYDRAIQELEKIIARNPKASGLTWYWLGRARFHKGLYPQATEAFERSLVEGNVITGSISRVEKEGAYNFLGWSYYHSAEYQKAIQAFDNSIEWSRYTLGPKIHWSSLCGRGWSRYFTGDFQTALNDFNQALPLFPPNNTAMINFCHRGLAFVNLALGNDDAALASVDKAHASQNYDQNYDLALINLVRGQKEKALEHWGGAGSAGVLVQDYQEGGVAGARIVEIESDGAAEAAGLMPGDIVKSMDGQLIARARDFAARISGSVPGKSVRIDILRNGSPLQKTLTVGSAEARMAKQPLIAPVVKVRPIALASSAEPVPPQEELPPVQPDRPSVPETMSPPLAPVISMDAVSVIPQEVPAGESFQVRIDLYAENQKNPAPKITVILHCAVSKDGKILKQFDPETFTVPNGEAETVTKTIRAGKTRGDYAVGIRLELEEKKAERSVTFSIK